MDDLNAEIERRQAIADAATPGPWKHRQTPSSSGMQHWIADTEQTELMVAAYGRAPDLEFAAHARAGYPQCLEALKLAVAALGSIQANATEWADSDKIIIEAMEALAAIKAALEAK